MATFNTAPSIHDFRLRFSLSVAIPHKLDSCAVNTSNVLKLKTPLLSPWTPAPPPVQWNKETSSPKPISQPHISLTALGGTPKASLQKKSTFASQASTDAHSYDVDAPEFTHIFKNEDVVKEHWEDRIVERQVSNSLRSSPKRRKNRLREPQIILKPLATTQGRQIDKSPKGPFEISSPRGNWSNPCLKDVGLRSRKLLREQTLGSFMVLSRSNSQLDDRGCESESVSPNRQSQVMSPASKTRPPNGEHPHGRSRFFFRKQSEVGFAAQNQAATQHSQSPPKKKLHRKSTSVIAVNSPYYVPSPRNLRFVKAANPVEFIIRKTKNMHIL